MLRQAVIYIAAVGAPDNNTHATLLVVLHATHGGLQVTGFYYLISHSTLESSIGVVGAYAHRAQHSTVLCVAYLVLRGFSSPSIAHTGS